MAMEPDVKARGRLGDILLECGMISKPQLEQALDVAQRGGKRLGEVLRDLGIVDDDQLSWALGVQFDLTFVELSGGMVDWQLVRRFSMPRMRELCICPISHTEGTIRAVVSDPTISQRAHEIRELFGGIPVTLQLAAREDIMEALFRAEAATTAELEYISEHERISGQLEKWVSALASGELNRLMVRPGTGESSAVSVSLSPALTEFAANLSVVDIDEYASRLGEFFSPTLYLPGGFCGIRHGRGSRRHRALRAISVEGLRGRLMALEALSVEFVEREISPVVVIASPSQRASKSAFFEAVTRRADSDPAFASSLVLALESRLDHSAPAVFQVEVPDLRLRRNMLPAVMSAAAPKITVFEVEPGENADAIARQAKSSQLTTLVLLVHATGEEQARAACPSACQVLFVPENRDTASAAITGAFEKYLV